MTTNKPEVKRYTPAYGVDSVMRGHLFMEECDHGAWVSLEDYEALRAECTQLRAAIRRLCNTYVIDDYYSGEQREERLARAVNRAIEAVQETTK